MNDLYDEPELASECEEGWNDEEWRYRDESEEEVEDYPDDCFDEDPIGEGRPPLGILSRGPLWLTCPHLWYGKRRGRLNSHLSVLSIDECEELVNFLCALEKVCEWPGCNEFNRELLRDMMAAEAITRGDFAVAERHRDLMEDPSMIDEWLEQEKANRP
jgi:hypothetical protein